MKDNRFLIYSLIATAVVVALICLAGPFLREATDRQEDTALAEHETVTTGATDTYDATVEVETDAYVYEGDALPSDWYVGVTEDPFYYDFFSFQSPVDRPIVQPVYPIDPVDSVEAYVASSQAARDGDLESALRYWEDYDPWLDDDPDQMLDFARCVFGRMDLIPIVYPGDEWEISGIIIQPAKDRIEICYHNKTNPERNIMMRAYIGRERYFKIQESRGTMTIDGKEFHVTDSAYNECVRDLVYVGGGDYVVVSLKSGITDEMLDNWQVCTLREYAATHRP